ncbi:DUF4041 domain-containing protein [Phyllobacterium zundukense]|uniref:DUF4041 domain-containing protein n=1 Tax=Phyllobacterium zundukense TaxID=1867719 RepID=A0ACD4CWY6_9HYPH|nr:DUF4041 domain-containing protein [Phyllobacterium zundukense]UXN58105.1 DUF4041 domain-containing protein [Phyllobacterium zundukense]
MEKNYMLIIIALILALLFVVWFIYKYLRERKQHRAVVVELNNKSELAEKALTIGRQLLLEKKELTARLNAVEARFQPVLDLDKEVAGLRAQINAYQSNIDELRASYADKKIIYDRLIKEVAIFDEKIAFAEMGVYEPHFEFTDSDEYKTAILLTRDAQKRLVTDKTAVICTTQWVVEGSAAKGQTMTNRNIRLSLRAFNNECDAAIANIRWNNANAMEKRIVNAQEQIDKLNASNKTYVSNEYLKLKSKELYLTHEHREKVKGERDERAEAARLLRDEQKLIRDLEKAQEEEERYQRLLAKAQAEADSIVGPQLDVFTDQIEILERDLAAAHARVVRAQAMAEKTRSGYVYIISNVGSFGDDVVKIGLTRRLDPADRVRELGDASVPFTFDTHAIIYSDDAPALEYALHNEFEAVRVNVQNYRKEFFRASIEEVEAAVKRLAPDAPFFKDVEAQDYRETLARRHQALMAADAIQSTILPDHI